jgi:hypothetical protein
MEVTVFESIVHHREDSGRVVQSPLDERLCSRVPLSLQ